MLINLLKKVHRLLMAFLKDVVHDMSLKQTMHPLYEVCKTRLALPGKVHIQASRKILFPRLARTQVMYLVGRHWQK